MKATDIEFRLRGLWIGLIFWLSFSAYYVDHRNLGAMISRVFARWTGADEELSVHLVFGLAAALSVIAALLRTWASSYLTKEVVHDARLHSETIIADGPYRYTRNPLYLAVDLLAISMAPLASSTGAVIAIVGIALFDYRLILREEAELQASSPKSFAEFTRLVPRLIPTLVPRIPRGNSMANWKSGVMSETFFWAFAIGLIVFAITLDMTKLMIAVGMAIGMLLLLGFQASSKKRKVVN